MVTYRTVQLNTNPFIDQAYHIARTIGCPEDKLLSVWNVMAGYSPALNERSFASQVKDAMVAVGLDVNYDKLLDVLEHSH